jgi:hypothetical protein
MLPLAGVWSGSRLAALAWGAGTGAPAIVAAKAAENSAIVEYRSFGKAAKAAAKAVFNESGMSSPRSGG